jgi:hypothetical protein
LLSLNIDSIPGVDTETVVEEYHKPVYIQQTISIDIRVPMAAIPGVQESDRRKHGKGLQ